MKVAYSPKARQRGDDLALLEQATNCLQEVVEPAAEQAWAEWDSAEDERGRHVYTLTLHDETREVRGRFSPSELGIPSYVRAALHRLWGGILKLRSDEQHQKVLELVRQLGED